MQMHAYSVDSSFKTAMNSDAGTTRLAKLFQYPTIPENIPQSEATHKTEGRDPAYSGN